MSTAVKELEKKKEPLFSKKNRRLMSDPFDDNNPITVQVLGICSALAITVKVEPAVVMSLSVVFVLGVGNVVVVATLVIVVDQFLKAFVYDVSKQLSVFVGLIITNCIIMGRFEAFALANTPWRSFLDGIGNAFGYGVILIAVALIREVIGSGAIYGYKFIPESWYLDPVTGEGFYANNGFFLFPPIALIIVGCIIWWQRSRNTKLIEEN